MVYGDLLGVLLVYIYVAVLLVVAEKILGRYPEFSRKILHIMAGNIVFLLPVFQSREVMTFIAAAPFIVFAFLMSPYTPIKFVRGKTSAAGHGMGLVYYAISWTVLAYVFFDHKEVIAIGILAMSYGDGFASLLGVRFGKWKYMVWGDEKSYVGSVVMFVFTFIMAVIALFFYEVNITHSTLMIVVIVALIAVVVEGITPRGLDNLSIPIIVSIIYWMLMFMM